MYREYYSLKPLQEVMSESDPFISDQQQHRNLAQAVEQECESIDESTDCAFWEIDE